MNKIFRVPSPHWYTLVCAIGYVLYWRLALPAFFVDGAVWAETGTDFLMTAYLGATEGKLFRLDNGYLCILPRALAFFVYCIGVPLWLAPWAVQQLSACLQALSVSSVCWSVFRPIIKSDLARFILAVSLIFHHEIELKTLINVAYWGAIPLFLLLWRWVLNPTPGWHLAVVTLGLACLLILSKAPFIAFFPVLLLLPLVVPKAAKRRTSVIAVAGLTAASGQLWTAYQSRMSGTNLVGTSEILISAESIRIKTCIFIRGLLVATLGGAGTVSEWIPSLTFVLASLATTVVLGCTLLSMRSEPKRSALWPLLLVGSVIAVSVTILILIPAWYSLLIEGPAAMVLHRWGFLPSVAMYLYNVIILTRAAAQAKGRLLCLIPSAAILWCLMASYPFGDGAGGVFSQNRRRLNKIVQSSSVIGHDQWLATTRFLVDVRHGETAQQLQQDSWCIPVAPLPFVALHNCVPLSPLIAADATAKAATLTSTRVWVAPEDMARMKVSALEVAVRGVRKGWSLAAFDHSGRFLARATYIVGRFEHGVLALFHFSRPVEGINFVEIQSADSDAPVNMSNVSAATPDWWWFGQLTT